MMGKKSSFRFTEKVLWFIPAVTVALGIFLLSTLFSIPFQVEGVSFLDKIEHCFAYFVLMMSFLIAFKKTNRLSASRCTWLMLLLSLYGFGLELTQYLLFPNRYFEWFDALANVLGVVLGFLIFRFIDRG